jgi:predicted MPP superfamily phosphohydrolase
MRIFPFIAIVAFFAACSSVYNLQQPKPIVYQKTSQPSVVFAHITDIHIGEGRKDFGNPGFLNDYSNEIEELYAETRLRNTVAHINSLSENEKIDFVMVSGDLTDSGEFSEFMKAKEILDKLKIPYFPLIGNHDVWPYTRFHEADAPIGDQLLNEVFDDHFEQLALLFPDDFTDNRHIKTISADGHTMFLQNYSFVARRLPHCILRFWYPRARTQKFTWSWPSG